MKRTFIVSLFAVIFALLAPLPALAVGEISTNQLANGVLAASTAGRLKMAASFFDAATLTAKIANDAITAAVFEAKFAAGAISASVDGRAAMENGWFDTATLGLKIANDAITTTVISDEIANSAFTSVHFSGAEIKFAAGALDEAGVDSLFADDSINAEDFALAGGGIFDAACITNANIAFIADDAFTAAEFVVAAGGKFAPNCLVEAGLDNLIADDAIAADIFTDKFAANSITTAGLNNAVVNDGIDGTVFEAKFAADSMTATGLDNAIPDDALTSTICEDKFAANSMTATAVSNAFATASIPAIKMDGTVYAPNTVINTPVSVVSISTTIPATDWDGNNDIPVFVANSPNMYILEFEAVLSTVEGGPLTCYLDGGANGAGADLSGVVDLNPATTGTWGETTTAAAPATRALAANSSIYIHASGNPGTVVGTFLIWYRNNL